MFFDRDGDGTADWVAIVAEVTAGEEGAPSGITVIAEMPMVPFSSAPTL